MTDTCDRYHNWNLQETARPPPAKMEIFRERDVFVNLKSLDCFTGMHWHVSQENHADEKLLTREACQQHQERLLNFCSRNTGDETFKMTSQAEQCIKVKRLEKILRESSDINSV